MRLIASLLFCACLAILPDGMAAAKIVDEIVAQVNDEVITLSELEQAMKYIQANPAAGAKVKNNQAFRRQALEMLIDRKLAKEEAKRYGITVPEKEIKKTVDDIKQKYGFTDDETLSKALAKDGMTMEQLRQQLIEQIQQDRLMLSTVRSKVKVSDAEIQQFYEQRYRQADNRVHIKIINLPVAAGSSAEEQEEVRALAERILIQARRGESFDKLMETYSKSTPNVPGGDLGYIRQSDIDPRFFEFLSNLRPGEIVPLRAPFGFQIIKMVDAKVGKAKSLSEARGEIEQILIREQMAKLFSEYLQSIRQKAHIKILL
ncbi:peptidylprolyl isomerase [Desulfobacca acetoxidans]|uniref:SurA domain protein n=1 Tax=Desulfobacca acetoxidans (strain ATCC 700848 / DSM 11109 / ASRB2) TaxID=880072 RepID=F2NC43_DESAR|nr:peptidylprolyl isomerase [Desulfobacca acetoxidans]AEB08838.1 SurA domain protein [Desulfobacca acetoxidans DSM 11109]